MALSRSTSKSKTRKNARAFSFSVRSGIPPQASDEEEVIHPAQMGINLGLFGNIAEAAFIRIGVLFDLLALVQDAAAGGCEEPGQHLDGCRFARSVRPQVAEDLPGLDAETDVVDGRKDRVFFGHPDQFEHGHRPFERRFRFPAAMISKAHANPQTYYYGEQ